MLILAKSNENMHMVYEINNFLLCCKSAWKLFAYSGRFHGVHDSYWLFVDVVVSRIVAWSSFGILSV